MFNTKFCLELVTSVIVIFDCLLENILRQWITIHVNSKSDLKTELSECTFVYTGNKEIVFLVK